MKLVESLLPTDPIGDYISEYANQLTNEGYTVAEVENNKPWGGYIRLENGDANRFEEDFFTDYQVNSYGEEKSPKLLIVAPGEELSWQYHYRRAELWRFLTQGLYKRSMTNEESDPILAATDEIVQFDKEERHRLIGAQATYTIVAEIWQHTNPDQPSDEQDIVRLHDRYQRS